MLRKYLHLSCTVLGALWSVAVATAQVQIPDARTQVQFAGPHGMQVSWYVKGADGKEGYSQPPLFTPARYNFKQGYTYRLKLTHIPGHAGLELYPTLEVPIASPSAGAFLAHNAVKLELTADDFRSVLNGQFINKTIYFPGNGVAASAGSPLLILRLGNFDGGPSTAPSK